MGTKRNKAKKHKRSSSAPAAASSGSARKTSGGVMQGLRQGFKNATVGDPEAKPSKIGNVIWTLLLVAAVAFLVYRMTQ